MTGPRPLRILVLAELGLLAAATFLGLAKNGHPLVPAARALFAPAGLLIAVHGGWILVDPSLASEVRSESGAPRAAWMGVLMLLVGAGVFGIGFGELVDDPVWRILAAPGIVACGLLLLFHLLRGRRRSSLWRRARDDGRARAWTVWAGLWMFGLSWPVLATWSLGLARL